jgi:hypothetical protein
MFEQFWLIKPSRAGDQPKSKARESWLKLLAGGVKPEVIIDAARQWAEAVRKDGDEGKRFVPMAVTWLNQQRFDGYAPVTPVDRDKLNATAEAFGWKWNGEKYVKVADLTPRSFTPARTFSVTDKATLFVSRETQWYAAMAERHEASTKKESYYGQLDGRPGIWIAPTWHVAGRATNGLRLHQLNAPATEVIEDQLPPYASALPLDAYEDALSVPDEEVVEFGA